MSLTSPSDYKGSVSIAANKFDTEFLQDYLDENESSYLIDLLGCELYDLFIADLVDGVPQTARFINIFNSICEDITNSLSYGQWIIDFDQFYCINRQNRSRGILAMLKGFMYFEYVRDQPIQNGSVGPSESVGVASNVLSNSQNNTDREYNRSVMDYWNIQYYILTNEDIYPEFNGIRKDSLSIL